MREGHRLLYGPASKDVIGGLRSSQSGRRRGDREAKAVRYISRTVFFPLSGCSVLPTRIAAYTTFEGRTHSFNMISLNWSLS
jgi:hypothetical protein